MTATFIAEAEVSMFLAKHTDLKTTDGDRRIMHQGGLPEREVMVSVRSPRASRVCAIASGCRSSQSHSLHACDPSAVRTALKEFGDADPDPLPEGHL